MKATAKILREPLGASPTVTFFPLVYYHHTPSPFSDAMETPHPESTRITKETLDVTRAAEQRDTLLRLRGVRAAQQDAGIWRDTTTDKPRHVAISAARASGGSIDSSTSSCMNGSVDTGAESDGEADAGRSAASHDDLDAEDTAPGTNATYIYVLVGLAALVVIAAVVYKSRPTQS